MDKRDEEIAKELGRRILYFRLKCGMTQEQFAEKMNRSVATISKIENGKTVPRIWQLNKIADILGTETYQFFTDKFDLEKWDMSPEQMDLCEEMREAPPQAIKAVTVLLKCSKNA